MWNKRFEGRIVAVFALVILCQVISLRAHAQQDPNYNQQDPQYTQPTTYRARRFTTQSSLARYRAENARLRRELAASRRKNAEIRSLLTQIRKLNNTAARLERPTPVRRTYTYAAPIQRTRYRHIGTEPGDVATSYAPIHTVRRPRRRRTNWNTY